MDYHDKSGQPKQVADCLPYTAQIAFLITHLNAGNNAEGQIHQKANNEGDYCWASLLLGYRGGQVEELLPVNVRVDQDK